MIKLLKSLREQRLFSCSITFQNLPLLRSATNLTVDLNSNCGFFQYNNKIAQRLCGNTAKVVERGDKMTEKLIMVFMDSRGAMAAKALPRFWVSICSYKIRPVKKKFAWLKVAPWTVAYICTNNCWETYKSHSALLC